MRYKLAPGVQRVRQFSGATLPGKITLGDYNLDSHPLISTWLAVNDQRGGIGIDRMDVSKDLDRCWTSGCNPRYRGHLVMPPLGTSLTGEPSSSIVTESNMFIHNLNVYGVFQNYSTGASTVHLLTGVNFGSSLKTLTGVSGTTDIAVGYLAGSETVVIAGGGDVDWTTNPASWGSNTNSTNITALAFHNDLLWGISSTGQLYFTHDLSLGWTTDALLQLNTNYLTRVKLFEGPRPDGELALYASTAVGLYILDEANGRFWKTPVVFTHHPMGGVANAVFRGAIYVSSGLAIHKYVPGTPGVVTVVGFDRDDGIPDAFQGAIVGLIPTFNELVAITNGNYRFGGSASSRYIVIYGWDERGWRRIWASPNRYASGFEAMYTAPPVVKTDKMYWIYSYAISASPVVHGLSVDLPPYIINPTQLPTLEYNDESATHETPWFDAGVAHQNKLAVEVRLETTNPTSSETVLVEYATNYVESYTSLGTISATGETTYHLPTSGNHVGVEFRSIKFRLTLSRGSTTTNTPDVIKLALLFMRTWDDLRAFSVTIDISEPWNGLTPLQQREALDTLFGTKTLVDFTFRDESDDTENHMVTVRGYSSLEIPGHSNIGQWQLQLVESH